MEIAIIQNTKRKTYGYNFSETIELSLLSSFLIENKCNIESYIDFLDDPKCSETSGNSIGIKKIKDQIFLYDILDDFHSYFFIATIQNFKKLLNDWIKTLKKNPREIIIKKDDNIFIEGLHFGPSKFDEFDQTNCNFEEAAEKNIFDFQSKKIKINEIEKEIFSGGFHSFNKKNIKYNNIEIINESSLINKVITMDFKFKDNFYINHAFFPKDWDIDKIKNAILNILKEKSNGQIEIEDKIIIFLGLINNISIKIFINEKFEILTAYPTLRDN